MATTGKNAYLKEVTEWMRNNFDGAYTVTINDDDEIVVNGDCMLTNYNLEHLPYKFNAVHGDFILGGIRQHEPVPVYALVSLENCPDVVDGTFNCGFCQKLTSLEGGPQKVDRYICNGCNLSNLNGIAQSIRYGEIKAYGNNGLVDISALETIPGLGNVDVDFASDFLYGSPAFRNLLRRNIISENFKMADMPTHEFA